MLTREEFGLAKKIAEDCLKLEDSKIKNYIQDSLTSFTKNLDISNLDDREKIFEFLRHQSLVLLNFNLNADLYSFGNKEKQKCHIAGIIIVKIIEDYIKTVLHDVLTKDELANAQSQISEISSKPKKYYSVINNKTGRRDEYSYLAWNIAWFLAFLIGILTGILIK